MKVFVYFNLHKKLWSVKAMEGENKGRVVLHTKYITLVNVKPKVSEAGRQRVLRERSKNVHAGLVGEVLFTDVKVYKSEDRRQLTYNPYKFKTFVDKQTLEPVESIDYAYMDADDRSVTVM